MKLYEWEFKLFEKDGDLHYVQQFESMQLAPIEAS